MSHFNVIEKYQFLQHGAHATKGKKRHKKDELLANPLSMFVDAVWEALPADRNGQNFEMEFLLDAPGSVQKTIHRLEFEFTNRLHRQVLQMGFLSPFKSGVVVFTNRVRKAGAKSWISQEYRIVVESDLDD